MNGTFKMMDMPEFKDDIPVHGAWDTPTPCKYQWLELMKIGEYFEVEHDDIHIAEATARRIMRCTFGERAKRYFPDGMKLKRTKIRGENKFRIWRVA